MVRMTIATVSLSGDLKEKPDAIAAAGFDGVEMFEDALDDGTEASDHRGELPTRGVGLLGGAAAGVAPNLPSLVPGAGPA